MTIAGMLLCLIQKCLSKPSIDPPSTTNPHIFSRQNKNAQTFSCSFCFVLFFSGSVETYKTKSFCLSAQISLSLEALEGRGRQCNSQVFCVVISSLAVGSIF